MTFTPSVLSTMDPNNTNNGLITSFIGSATVTTGYNTITLNVSSSIDSSPGGLVLEFSPDNTLNTIWISYSADTVYANLPFVKSYPVLSQYYRVNYTNSSLAQTSIQSHLSTVDDSKEDNSMTVFNNDVEASLDAFGKLRVSNPQTLLDIRFPGQSAGSSPFLLNDIQISQNVTGTGLGGYNITAFDSKCLLSVTGAYTLINQSRKYCTYQPGKSLLFMASAVMNNTGNTGSYQTNVGYYDDYNGLYFKYDSSTGMSINIRNNKLINISDETIPQNEWNIDRMDGTGSSKLNLNFLNTQLFVMDMEWLGVGRIRFGFYAYGKIHYCHQELNINFLISPYTSSINLPIRHEVTSSSGSSASMTQICSTVISEGGYNPIGRTFSAVSGAISTSSSETPILAIRGGSLNYYHQTILPTSFSVFCDTNAVVILYRVRLYRDNIPFTVTQWTNTDSSYSVAQYAVGGSNIINFSAGTSIVSDSGYFSGKNTVSLNDLTDVFNNIFELTQNASGIPDVLVITAQNVSNNQTVYTFANINWQEIY